MYFCIKTLEKINRCDISDKQDDMFTWWLTLEIQPNYIEKLAFKILNLKPHNASELYSDILLPEDQLDIDHIMNLQHGLFNSQLQSTDTIALNNIHNNKFLGNKNFDIDK
ncbi:13459_t:CDS:2, partial [Racocetra persica]